ncbi:histidinol-phosphate aminotransferase family protein [Pseudenhygromyxa sp. WMMC2535]|uniref:aminotransferase class I/II-fold pyridoxal phosphate-dependent enzyme n=1 Tax=Pseudenhygromyxa sp. WMMC2535 TaxID=2712867 RepID=UPI001554C575|nr:histidinol-phosphate aminotransferase family protein [Pseudenhygromyxa sp. WMMC2535]
MNAPEGVELPLNLGLNDGTYAPQRCLEVFKRYTSRTDLRNYGTPDNAPLRQAIAKVDGVEPDNVFLHNGTGPILKQAIPYLLKRRVLDSPRRILRHAVSRAGFPIITPRFTYSKVPKKAAEGGMHVDMLPLDPGDDFRFDVDRLERRLERGPGLVYIVNPNNPTGNVLVTRDQMIPLFERFPEARFWIDEAYVQYVDPEQHGVFSSLVPRFQNLMVSRTFSFAYGLAAVRIGYLLAKPSFVHDLEKQITDYRLGTLQEQLGVAALEDPDHLPFVREVTAKAREQLYAGIAELDGIQAFPSQVNFILCRFTDGRRGAELKAKLAQRGILIKIFEPACGFSYDPYFRLTIGLPEENAFLLEQMAEVLG